MLRVKTYVDKSAIHGLGLFAKEFIPSGSIVWRYNPNFTAKLTKQQVEALTEEEVDHLNESDYFWVDEEGSYMFPLDNDRFMNHSSDPNVVEFDLITTRTSRDVEAGEELTADYKTLVPREHWQDYYWR